MNLVEALLTDNERVVAFVGGGGKTTSMYRLASELAGRGERVVVTTTTHIMVPNEREAESLILFEDVAQIVDELKKRFASQHVVAVGTRVVTPQGKIKGIPPEWVDEIARLSIAGHVVVEADGSAGMPFKAPAEHEPVIPASTDLVVPIVGIDVLGAPLSAETVHRPERVIAIARVALGEPVTAEVVASVLLHPDGATKGAPTAAQIVPLVNKVDDSRLDLAREIARRLIDGGARRVVLACVKEEPPVREVMGAK
ncbi:MAG: selenium cofactor biosynthesis protein YqeC [Chloroflexi bacterium]|nr:selenium cofactor biosynthesis protein YqeC [Chloroflexota bacterium]MDA8187836.1 selenium cofactor biosynthesis protein YqeC [Dehalococcoidales bacterium]